MSDLYTNNYSAIQGKFNIQIKGLNKELVDVTEYVAFGVTYEERADMIKMLTFTIDKYAEVYLERLSIGFDVIMSGGTLDNFKQIFIGSITRLKVQLPKEGAIRLTIECMSTTWQQLGKNTSKIHTYPDLHSQRSFAKGKSKLYAKDIVKGICEENNIKVDDSNILIPNDKLFSLTDCLKQDSVSDWNLLVRLASKCGCTVWTEFDGAVESLHFIDRSKVINSSSSTYFKNNQEVSFLYPLKGAKQEGHFVISENQNNFVYNTLGPSQILILEASIEQDIAAANAISYAASSFDFDKGEEVSLLADSFTNKDGKKVLRFYDIDDEKIAETEKTNPKLANQIRNMGGGNLDWETQVKPFLKEVLIVDEDTAVFDQAFFGITVNATVVGDVEIRSQKTYKVYGILKYSTNSTEDRFWLYSLKHRWEEDGFYTDVTFRK